MDRGSQHHRVQLLAYAAVALVWLLVHIPLPEGFARDGGLGVQLAGAQLVLAGEHPFIDFHISYGPLAFYLSAAAQALSGDRVLGEWLLGVAGYLVAYVALFALVLRVGNRPRVSWALALLLLLCTSRIWKYFIAIGPALTLFCAWTYCARPSRRRLLALGASVAFAGLLRHDLGAYTFAGAVTAVACTAWRDRSALLRELLALSGFVVLAASPYLLWAAWSGGLGAYLGDSIRIGLSKSSGLSRPFPPLHWKLPLWSAANAVAWLYVFIYLQPAIGLWVYLRSRLKMDREQQARWLTALVMSGLLLIQSAHRSDLQHLFQAMPLSFVVIALVLHRWRDRGRVPWVWNLLAGATVVVLLIRIPWPDPTPVAHLKKLSVYAMSNQELVSYVLDHHPDQTVIAVADDVRRCTTADERIFVLPFSPGVAYFADRLIGGGLLMSAPGFYDAAEDQRRAIAALEEQRVPLFVDKPFFVYDGLPERALTVTHPILSEYLAGTYAKVLARWQFTLAVRRDLAKSRRRALRSCLSDGARAPGRPEASEGVRGER